MRTLKRIAAAALAFAAVCWVAYGNHHEATRDARAVAQSVAVEVPADAEADPAESLRAATPAASAARSTSPVSLPAPIATNAHADPLPPLDEPFAQHLDELRRRAAQGDAPAACRLGMQLSYCNGLGRMRRINEEELARRAATGAVESEGDALLRDGLKSMEVQCRGVSATDPLEAYRLQLAAARAGIVQAQLQFAVFPPLDDIDVIDHVEIWREWRAAAVAGLESALANGDVRAPLDLARAYGDQPFGPWTPRLAAADPYRAFVYARLSTMVAERSATPGRDLSTWVAMEHGELLSAAERERATREANRLFEASYAGLPVEAFEKNQLNGNDFADCER